MFLGQFKIDAENYESVKNALKEILALLNQTKSIEINQVEYELEYFLGCDYKMLLLLYGKKSANSSYSCIYCKANLKEIPDLNSKWTIERSLNDENEDFEPLISFIDYKKVIVDLLHALLRISDSLYYLLILKLSDLDNNPASTDLKDRPNLEIFINFLISECKITNPSYSSELSEEKIKFRHFNGNERMRIFKELFKKYLEKRNGRISQKRKNISDLYPNLPLTTFRHENYVWFNFYKLLTKIKNFRKKTFEPETIQPLLIKWLRSYLQISKVNRNFETIGPYLHIWTFHTVELLTTHGDINLFNTQGLEKLNGFSIKYHNLCTNKNKTKNKYIEQMIKKRNRIEFLYLDGDFEEFKHFDLDQSEDDENISDDSLDDLDE